MMIPVCPAAQSIVMLPSNSTFGAGFQGCKREDWGVLEAWIMMFSHIWAAQS